MNMFAQFIDKNRQLSSTTELVKAALKVDGYIIVHNHQFRVWLLQKFPILKPERVLTYYNVMNGDHPTEQRPIFVDAAVMCCVKE